MTYTNHGSVVTVKRFIDEESMVYLLSLPQKRQTYDGEWKATQVAPCPILMKCATCLRYLPPSGFYSIKKGKNGRIDALGVKRSARCVRCNHIDYIKLDARQKLYYSARQRANLKGLEFTITPNDIVIPKLCPVLGIPLSPTVGMGSRKITELESSPSIDRIDNSKGYTKDNICVISLRANNIKKDATLTELRLLEYHMENPSLVSPVDFSEKINEFSRRTSQSMSDLSSDMRYYFNIDHRQKLINAAKRRRGLHGFDPSLTKEDIIIPQFCPVFGMRLTPSIGNGRRNLNELDDSPSIDRIDSSKGYTKDNVQVISLRANNLKKDATLHEIKSLVKYVKKFYGELKQ